VDINEKIRTRFGIADTTTPMIGRRGYTREMLAEFFNELGFKKGAEIGVLEGEFSLVLLKAIPGLKLICADAWMDYVKKNGDKTYEVARENLSGYDVDFKRMLSMESAKEVEDGSLDFVYIDANHQFDGVMSDIIFWSKKVRPGGIVAGHDYHTNVHYGVVPAVDAYARAHGINEYYVTREKKPTWFWVKKKELF